MYWMTDRRPRHGVTRLPFSQWLLKGPQQDAYLIWEELDLPRPMCKFAMERGSN